MMNQVNKLDQHIFVINKPKGPTSHDIINRLRRITNIRKIGHAGTLDPLASGILVVGIGREGTKQLGTIVKHDKTYIADIKLGVNSTTDDEEGEKINKFTGVQDSANISKEMIEQILPKFTGKIKQTPPVYSAIKVKGKPAYKRTRAGEEIQLEPRDVVIYDINILDYKWPILKIQVECGSGVYIRSLARDIGASLKVGGYLANLRRTKIGKYDLSHALTLEQFEKIFNENINKEEK